MLFAEFERGQAGFGFEQAGKIVRVGDAHQAGDFRYALIALAQQRLGGADAPRVYIFGESRAHVVFEQAAERIGGKAKVIATITWHSSGLA